MRIRSAYVPRPRVFTPITGDSMTKQQLLDECNINFIMAKYLKTGLVEHVNHFGPSYGFASGTDFQESMNTLLKAQEMFDALPAATRRAFGNNPADFLDFVNDPENAEKLKEPGFYEDGPNKKEPDSPPADTPEPKTEPAAAPQ